jgi:hypothetical protein
MPPRRNWDSTTPLPQASISLPPEPKRGGALACGGGGGGVPIPTTGEKLSTLPTLCANLPTFTCLDPTKLAALVGGRGIGRVEGGLPVG